MYKFEFYRLHGSYYDIDHVFDSDILYCEIVSNEDKYLQYADTTVFVDGHKLVPIIKLYKLCDDEKMCHELGQKIIFDE